MAMTPRGWTTNALATELDRDRRTIAKKLAHVPPVEVRGRSKYYRLRDALAASSKDRRGRAAELWWVQGSVLGASECESLVSRVSRV